MIGWPVAHSKSPVIHNAAAAATRVDLVYVAFAVEPGAGGRAVDAMRTLGMRGLSVTMPHKVDVMAAVDEATPIVHALGAANHLTNTDGHVVANNTDGEGFLLGLADATGTRVSGARVGVLGGGGAARAIIYACGLAGAEVHVVTRNPEQAERAISMGAGSVVASSIEEFDRCDVVVNATPVGMTDSLNSGSMPFGVDGLRDDAIVVDIVYNPLETPLLAAARARDLRCVDGLAMLVGQAAAQFETWTGVPAPLDVMRAAARV